MDILCTTYHVRSVVYSLMLLNHCLEINAQCDFHELQNSCIFQKWGNKLEIYTCNRYFKTLGICVIDILMMNHSKKNQISEKYMCCFSCSQSIIVSYTRRSHELTVYMHTVIWQACACGTQEIKRKQTNAVYGLHSVVCFHKVQMFVFTDLLF